MTFVAYDKIPLMQWEKQKQRGFTIVELLIVIVVIAILAAITVVSFNGIQQRSKESAVKSSASQVAKKLLTYSVDNSDSYPSDLIALATLLRIPTSSISANTLVSSDGTVYQYSVNNNISPRTFCITAAKNSISYFVSQPNTSTPSNGVCVGHSAYGAVQVSNLITNPRPNNSFWFPSSSSVGTVSFVNSGAESAVRSTRVTSGNYALYSNRSSPVSVAQAGDVYTIKFTIVASTNMNLTYQVGYGTATASFSGLSLPIELASGVPQEITHKVTMPSGSDGQPIFNKFFWTDSTAGDWFEVSKVMWVKGDYNGLYADGDSPGWTWSGASNNSTSNGPTL